MEVEGSQKSDLEFKETHLDPDNNEVAVVNVENEVVSDQMPELHESVEPSSPKRNGRYNLRKSLAWDSAFFTSAGVLDPEEMSSMITGADKAEKYILPGIEEDLTGSTESISTLQSDNLTLESLDDDLFLDIRASIQRSSEKASTFRNSGSKTAATAVNNGAISSPRKEDLASQSKNPKPASKKTSGLQAVRVPKSQPKQIIGKPGSGKELKQDRVQSEVKSIAKVGESKPPKAISKPTPTFTATLKRDSMGTGRARSECGSSKPGIVSNRASQPPKVTTLSAARKVLPKPTISGKPSALRSSVTSKVQCMRSSISSESSGSSSSEVLGKSPSVTANRNLLKSKSVATAPPSKTISKTPSRAPLKNKQSLSTLSAYVKSNKISSSVSPASSISEWSSASSSSVVNQRSCNSRTSLDASSCRSLESDVIHSELKNHSTNQRIDGHENSVNATLGNSSKKSSTQTGILQAPMRPTGLRMPSPKIGHFDVVKSLARVPTGSPQSQSGLGIMFPKNGTAVCSTTPSSNKLKNSNVPTPRTVNAFASINFDCVKATPPASLLQENFKAPGSDSCVSAELKDPPPFMFLEVEGNPTEENYQNDGDVQVKDAVEQVIDAGLGDIFHENKGDLKNEMDLNTHKVINIVDIKNVTVEESSALRKDSCVSSDLNDSHRRLFLEVKCNAVEENLEKAGEVQFEDGIGQVLNAGLGDIIQENKGDLKNETDLNMYKVMNVGDIKIGTVEENNASGNDSCVSPVLNDPPLSLFLEVKGNAAEDIFPKAGEVKVDDGAEEVIDCLSIVNENKSDLKNEMDLNTYEVMNMGDMKIVSAEESNASGHDSCVSTYLNDPPPSLSVEVKGNAVEGNFLKAGDVEVEDGVEEVIYSGLCIVHENKSDSKYEIDLKMKIATVEESNASGSEYIGQSGYEDALIKHEHLVKDPAPIFEDDDKENRHVKSQGEGLKEHTTDEITNISCSKDEVISEISGPVLSFPATSSECSPNRAPFAPKNFFCNDDFVSMSKNPSNQVEDNTDCALSPSEQKENS